MKLAPNQILGPYRIVRLLSRGGMGEVYEAFEERLERKVALKIVTNSSPVASERFLLEAKALAKISHPNVVTIFSVGHIDDIDFIAMEFIEGCALDKIKDFLVLNAYESMLLITKVLSGLKALHDKNILHRDIKPHNIVLQTDGEVKIVDFGLATKLDSSDKNDETASGTIYGTPRYLPPEVATGYPAIFQSDLWSTGAVFYELIVGERLIDPKGVLSFPEIMAGYLNFEPKIPIDIARNLDLKFEKILRKMLQPDPVRRYQNAEQILEDLKSIRPPSGLPKNLFYKNLAAEKENITEFYTKLTTQDHFSPYAAKRILTHSLHFDSHVALNDDTTLDASSTKPFIMSQLTLEKAKSRFIEEVRRTTPWLIPNHEMAPKMSVSSPSQPSTTQSSLSFWFATLLTLIALSSLPTLFWYKTSKLKLSVATSTKVSEPIVGKTISERSVSSASPGKAFPDNQRLLLRNGATITFNWQNQLDFKEGFFELARDRFFLNIALRQFVRRPTLPIQIVNLSDEYYWRVVDDQNRISVGPYQFEVIILAPPKAILPKNGSYLKLPKGTLTQAPITVSFIWQRSKHSKYSQVQISNKEVFKTPLLDEILFDTQTYKVLLPIGTYWWRVRHADNDGNSEWTTPLRFEIGPDL